MVRWRAQEHSFTSGSFENPRMIEYPVPALQVSALRPYWRKLLEPDDSDGSGSPYPTPLRARQSLRSSFLGQGSRPPKAPGHAARRAWRTVTLRGSKPVSSRPVGYASIASFGGLR